MTRLAPTVRVHWRWLGRPMFVAVAVAFVAGMVMVHDVASVLVRGGLLQRRLDDQKAILLADAAALDAFGSGGWDNLDAADDDAMTVVERSASHVHVTTRCVAGSDRRFVAPVLTGRAPAAFGSAFAAAEVPEGVEVRGRSLPRVEMPSLAGEAIAAAVLADNSPLFRREPAIALQHWQAGTDAVDYVWTNRFAVRHGDLIADLVVVPGNLWFEPGAMPCEVVLAHDLVVLVQGNVYLGRSLRVVGSGRLVFVARGDGDASSFADADGNGRWSLGDTWRAGATSIRPLEGAGCVWLGLPSGSGQSPGQITCDAALVVAGELHLAAEAVVQGPLVLGHGVTRLAGAGSLVAAGVWRFEPERERVPGFVTRGVARPGLLRSCSSESLRLPGMPTMSNETLVVSSPGR